MLSSKKIFAFGNYLSGEEVYYYPLITRKTATKTRFLSYSELNNYL